MNVYFLLFLGSVVHLLGNVIYIRAILRGDVKPNRVSYIIWSILPMIGTFAALSDGVGWATLPTFMAGFGPILIFFASFYNPKSYWKLQRFDYVCGVFALLALSLWGITGEPIIAIAFAIIGDFFGTLPTVVKAWKYPETESWIPFAGATFNQFTAFFVMNEWSFSAYSFPLYNIVACGVIALLVLRKRIFKFL